MPLSIVIRCEQTDYSYQVSVNHLSLTERELRAGMSNICLEGAQVLNKVGREQARGQVHEKWARGRGATLHAA